MLGSTMGPGQVQQGRNTLVNSRSTQMKFSMVTITNSLTFNYRTLRYGHVIKLASRLSTRLEFDLTVGNIIDTRHVSWILKVDMAS